MSIDSLLILIKLIRLFFFQAAYFKPAIKKGERNSNGEELKARKSRGPLIERARNNANKKINEKQWAKTRQRGEKRKNPSCEGAKNTRAVVPVIKKPSNEEAADKNFLKFTSTENWEEILRRWERTAALRTSDIKNKKVETFIEEWPALICNKGFELVKKYFVYFCSHLNFRL